MNKKIKYIKYVVLLKIMFILPNAFAMFRTYACFTNNQELTDNSNNVVSDDQGSKVVSSVSRTKSNTQGFGRKNIGDSIEIYKVRGVDTVSYSLLDDKFAPEKLTWKLELEDIENLPYIQTAKFCYVKEADGTQKFRTNIRLKYDGQNMSIYRAGHGSPKTSKLEYLMNDYGKYIPIENHRVPKEECILLLSCYAGINGTAQEFATRYNKIVVASTGVTLTNYFHNKYKDIYLVNGVHSSTGEWKVFTPK